MSKILVITGGTSGIGEVTVDHLAKSGWKVVLLARNEEKAKKVITQINQEKISFIHCDLNDLSSVRNAADRVKEQLDRIDVLMNNAGGILQRRYLTKDGFEMSFQVNHLGHFLLTYLLMDLLMKSRSRVINISSEAHHAGNLNFNDLMWKKRRYSGFKAYGDGKLCNIYFSRELHRRYNSDGITSFSVHPGVVDTNFGSGSTGIINVALKLFKFFMISPEKGAETQIFLSTQENVERYSGKYFEKRKIKSTSDIARDDEKAQRLWEISEKLVQPFLR